MYRLRFGISKAHAFVSQFRSYETGIQIYNCKTRKLVPVVLSEDKLATWYTCGPTVYDSTHLGHASCYVKIDIIQRILRQHFGINLVTAMNVTDIDDKIIARSVETAQDWRSIATTCEQQFWRDLKQLNVVEPNIKLRVTDHIAKIIAFIESLLAKNMAYVAPDNSVYFNVKRFPRYGQLQHVQLEPSSHPQLENKNSTADFALWKARQADGSEPTWLSPWGAGRPGWHIECSALASFVFGRQLDFHAGGIDLRFPHHENEEAQSCAFHNTDEWVRYWLHTGHLKVAGQTEKMSKSLKNTIGIEQLLANYSADAFRMACVLSKYRNAMEYSPELMEVATSTLQKYQCFQADCEAYLEGKKIIIGGDNVALLSSLRQAENAVDACLKDDFDTAGVIAALAHLTRSFNDCVNAPNGRQDVETLGAAPILHAIAATKNFVNKTLQVFGFHCAESPKAIPAEASAQLDVDALLQDLLYSRQAIRERAVSMRNKELFQICDELRICLKQHGIDVRDHRKGSSWVYNNVNKK